MFTGAAPLWWSSRAHCLQRPSPHRRSGPPIIPRSPHLVSLVLVACAPAAGVTVVVAIVVVSLLLFNGVDAVLHGVVLAASREHIHIVICESLLVGSLDARAGGLLLAVQLILVCAFLVVIFIAHLHVVVHIHTHRSAVPVVAVSISLLDGRLPEATLRRRSLTRQRRSLATQTTLHGHDVLSRCVSHGVDTRRAVAHRTRPTEAKLSLIVEEGPTATLAAFLALEEMGVHRYLYV
mmetsp:Transcript_18168/g.51686  ORF Transcript_18168/g.51686 Transcript_18168/m.51686 type:complete len:236 (+) Transcript_18168:733-1440(+)